MASQPRVFTIPASAPFLPTLIDALLGDRLGLNFKAAGDPLKLERASEALWKGFEPQRTNWTNFVDHLEHVMKIAPGAAGFGTDFDGVEDVTDGLEDVSMLPKVTEELLRRGHSEEEVRGVLGENFLRFLARVEATAASLSSEPPDATTFGR